MGSKSPNPTSQKANARMALPFWLKPLLLQLCLARPLPPSRGGFGLLSACVCWNLQLSACAHSHFWRQVPLLTPLWAGKERLSGYLTEFRCWCSSSLCWLQSVHMVRADFGTSHTQIPQPHQHLTNQKKSIWMGGWVCASSIELSLQLMLISL